MKRYRHKCDSWKEIPTISTTFLTLSELMAQIYSLCFNPPSCQQRCHNLLEINSFEDAVRPSGSLNPYKLGDQKVSSPLEQKHTELVISQQLPIKMDIKRDNKTLVSSLGKLAISKNDVW